MKTLAWLARSRCSWFVITRVSRIVSMRCVCECVALGSAKLKCSSTLVKWLVLDMVS